MVPRPSGSSIGGTSKIPMLGSVGAVLCKKVSQGSRIAESSNLEAIQQRVLKVGFSRQFVEVIVANVSIYIKGSGQDSSCGIVEGIFSVRGYLATES